MENNFESKSCYNCQAPMEAAHVFCPVCGQKHTTGRIGLKTLIKDFFSNNFHFDTKAIRSIKGLLYPGFLTKEYFQGIHKKYNSPVQLFLVLSIIFFTILSYKFEDSNIMSLINLKELVESEEARSKLLNGGKNSLDMEDLNEGIFEIDISNAPPKDSTRKYKSFQLLFVNLDISQDSINFGEKSFPISLFKDLNPSEFVQEHFSALSFFNKILYTQSLKLGFKGESLYKFLLLRSPILILLSLPIFALLQQLLYIRRPYYFVEHLTFLLHILCFTTFLLIPYLGFELYQQEWVVNVFFLLGAAYLLFAMKRFYNQSWAKTTFKFLLSGFLGIFALTFAILFIIFLSVLIF